MASRPSARLRFLNATPFGDWSIEPLVADASARSYFRLCGENKTAILADVPPETEDYGRFLKISDVLDAAGLNVPKCLASDPEAGFFVISDLGPTAVAEQVLREPKDRPVIFDGLIDLLVHLRQVHMPSLPHLNSVLAGEMLSPLFDHYGGQKREIVQAAMTDSFEKQVSKTLCLSLRDFHAENLIWDPVQAGIKRFGLLDFQDAFLAPDGYDLASFTRDVRRNVSVYDQRLLEQKFADACGLNHDEFHCQVAILSIQRNLRILGVFANLIVNGKTRYRDFLPQTWQYIVQDLEHPDLGELASVIRTHIPPPKSN
jgi:aminoglycoside/choline kinase family phosphotransferase